MSVEELLLELVREVSSIRAGKTFNPKDYTTPYVRQIDKLIEQKQREVVEATWDYTMEGYNGEYNGLTHNGGERYTDSEVLDKVVQDVLQRTPINPKEEKDS